MSSCNTAVRQLGISGDLLSATTLPHVIYADAHAMETRHARERTAEQWARLVMEDVTDAMRDRLSAAWAAIELDLTPAAAGTIAGWRITSSTPQHVLLQANSELGFQGELAITVIDNAVQLATFVTTRDGQARDAWFRVVPAHLAFVRSLLEYTADCLSAGTPNSAD